MTDLVQAVTVFSTGAAGCLAMAKLMQTMERRRNAHSQQEAEEEDEEKSIRELFPNGERRQVIRAIQDLKRENETRREENQNMMGYLERIAAHLKIIL